jgi:HEAT repeat protein
MRTPIYAPAFAPEAHPPREDRLGLCRLPLQIDIPFCASLDWTKKGKSVPVEDYLPELVDSSVPLVVARLVNLSGLTPEEIPAFEDAWRNVDAHRRRQVVRELVELAEDNVELNFDAVFRAGLSDSDAEVRRFGILGLWEYEGRDLIPMLVDLLLRDADETVRAEAALALGRYALKAEFDEIRASDAGIVDDALREAIADSEQATEVRARAVEAVGARSQPWVPPIIEDAYRSGHHRLRVGALHAMGRNCDSRWLSTLVEELRSDDAEMRYEAATACGSLGDEEAVPHLLPLLKDDDAEVQEAAVQALGQIGGQEAKRVLEDCLASPQGHVRDAALDALAELDFGEDPLAFKLRG